MTHSHSLQYPIRTYPAPNANASSQTSYFCIYSNLHQEAGKKFSSYCTNCKIIFSEQKPSPSFWHVISYVLPKLFLLLLFVLLFILGTENRNETEIRQFYPTLSPSPCCLYLTRYFTPTIFF